MDVDAISTEERNKRLRKGECFICGQQGHMARSHQDPNFKSGTNNRNRGNFGNRPSSENRNPATIAQQIPEINRKSIYLRIKIQTKNGSLNVDEKALADTGASGLFIDERYAKYLNLERIPLEEPLDVYNVDGTPNKKGTITHYARLLLSIGGRTTWERFYITNL
ncbi:hypothetical protein HYPSUDRAFT_97926, partial [Hypholoma sublateritium FD-334 SS-4]